MLSRAQLAALGVSHDAIRRQVRAGVWVAVGRSALVVPGSPDTLAVNTRVLSINHPSLVATGASVVALSPGSPFTSLLSRDTLPWFVGPTDRRWFGMRHPEVRVVERAGLFTASDFDAVVDLLRFLPPKKALAAGMTAVQRRLATVERLQRAAEDLRGYAGMRQMRGVLVALGEGAQSIGEHRLQRVLKGVEGWVANHPVVVAGHRFVLDLCFPEQMIVIEFDGWAYHSDPEAFERDRFRQNLLMSAGWLVLRFTWSDLECPQQVVAQVRRALAQRTAA